jgi:hypothetical protein
LTKLVVVCKFCETSKTFHSYPTKDSSPLFDQWEILFFVANAPNQPIVCFRADLTKKALFSKIHRDIVNIHSTFHCGGVLALVNACHGKFMKFLLCDAIGNIIKESTSLFLAGTSFVGPTNVCSVSARAKEKKSDNKENEWTREIPLTLGMVSKISSSSFRKTTRHKFIMLPVFSGDMHNCAALTLYRPCL